VKRYTTYSSSVPWNQLNIMARMYCVLFSTYTQTWIFGTVACKILSAMKGVNGYVSVLTMVLMSVDRYWAVIHPLRSMRYRTVRNSAVVCVLVWLVCALIMLPYWLYADVGGSSLRRDKCEITWPLQSQSAHLWFWANFELIVGFIVPVIVVGICYTMLLVGLSRHRRDTTCVRDHRAVTSHSGPQQPMRKVTTMVLTVTIVFIVCWTPYHVISYYDSIETAANARLLMTSSQVSGSTGLPCDDHIQTPMPDTNAILRHVIMNAVAQGLIFVSSCCNPFIYCISSRKFRKCI